MSKALVLNASFEPLCLVSTRRAVVLVLRDKAEILHAEDASIRSERVSLAEPSVIRLVHFVKVPFQRRAALSRRAVFFRDGHRCQYCGGAAENIDHVMPRSRGGAHIWENVVAACRRCNGRKENRTPVEAGLRLRRAPSVPRNYSWLAAAVGRMHPHWQAYLEPEAVSA